MDFKQLQKMQSALDKAILADKPKMSAEERFNKTLVALSVELAEVANCAEHFKFWKDNKGKVDENRFGKQEMYAGDDLVDMNYIEYETGLTYTFEQAHHLTLVEEASDCLHFILSLANQLDVDLSSNEGKTYRSKVLGFPLNRSHSLETDFLNLNQMVSGLSYARGLVEDVEINKILAEFINYYDKLSITTDELEQAYYAKNKINYERLENGY